MEKYQNTEIKTEQLADGCWIELQCHSSEHIRGWAFRVGGSSIGRIFEWGYGYPSEDEARNVAIDIAEEIIKSNIRESERKLAVYQQSLTEIHQVQRTKA